MSSAFAALAWEIWRRGRRSAWLVLGCVSICGLINLLVAAERGLNEASQTRFSALYGFLMTLSFLFLMGMFNYTEFNATKEWNGFPYRLFTLPLRTWQLVAVPMLLGVVSVEAVYLAWIKLVWTHPPVLTPEWFGIVLGAYMVFYQTALWSLAGFRILRIVAMSLGGVSSIGVACLPFLAQAMPSPWLSERRLMALLAGAAVSAFLLAWAAVARQRCGGGRRRSFVKGLGDRIADVMPRRSAGFGSMAAAQFWFEWRRTGWLLPVCAGFVIVAIIGPLSWFNREDPRYANYVLGRLLGMPLVLAFVIGKGFSKFEFWSTNLSLPPFLAIRPMAAGEFVVAKLKVAALSVALTWLVILAFLGLWLPLWANTARLKPLLIEFRMGYPHSWQAITVLGFFGYIVLTWRCLVSGLWVGLSGNRAYYAGSAGLQVILPALVLLAVGLWSDAIDREIDAHPDLVKSVALRSLGWLLGLLVVGKAWFAAFSWSRISPARTRQYLVIWSSATVGFIILATLSAPLLDTYRVEHLYILAALLAFPLARLGVAPWSVSKNRHSIAFTRAKALSPMKKSLAIPALVLSGIALILAGNPGRLAFRSVDAGGHQVRMFLSGHGKPAVVFETGGSAAAGGPLEAWERVQPAVSMLTTAVSYDRAGIGWSAPGPKPRDARQVARELHTALRNAGVPAPYILVGHSFGGPLIRVFAGLYPEEVGGMVLVDPTQEEFVAWNEARDPTRPQRQDEEWKDIQASFDEAHASRVPPGVPVILITAMGPRVLPRFVTEKQREELRAFRPMWLKFHREWLERIPGGRHVITENSGHSIPFEEPDVVVKAIRQVVEQARGVP